MQEREPPLSAMPAPPPLCHGGDLARVAAEPGAFTGPWLDLSTGINPWPYPAGRVPDKLWARLPGAALEAALRRTAAAYYGAPDADCLVPAPGSQALIQWLPRLRARARVAVLGPAYGEHAAQWSAAGHAVAEVRELAAIDPRHVEVAVVANPNNPDGRLLAPAALLRLAERLAARGGWLVVDEAFADMTPEASLAGEATRPGLVVLRSFGKFFGLAGLRLGFALAGPPLAGLLRQALGPWPVSGPALWIATDAFADRDWTVATRRRLAEAARALDALLAGAGLEVAGGTDLFRLAAHPAAQRVYRSLLRHGIYVRHFAEAERWLRFGLPADDRGCRRLERALAEALPALPVAAAASRV